MNTEMLEGEVIEFNPDAHALAVFSPFESQLAELRNKNAVLFDYTDPVGNKAARSQIATVKKVKGSLEKTRKSAKAASLEFGRKLDSTARGIEEQLQEMIDMHEVPLKEIEAKEERRKLEIHSRIATLSQYQEFGFATTSEQWASALSHAEQFPIDASLGEFAGYAISQRDKAVETIKVELAAKLQWEKDQEDLRKMRSQQAESERKAREDKIANEAAERATREAEAKAEQERIAASRKEAEAERQRQEQATRQALALETAKRQQAEAERRAAQAEQTAKENAAREVAAKAEDDRIAAEKREANKKHQAKINNAAVADLVKAGLLEDMAKLAVTAIAKREVSHVSISY